MLQNKAIKPVEIVLRREKKEIKEKEGGGDSNQDIL
jgi:hypothetical protein